MFFSFLGTIYIAHSLDKPSEAVISLNGKVVSRCSLRGESRLRIKGALGDSEIRISNGKARIVSSPCVQKFCVHQGWIEGPGECIICAPNRVVVKVIGESENKLIDAISK